MIENDFKSIIYLTTEDKLYIMKRYNLKCIAIESIISKIIVSSSNNKLKIIVASSKTGSIIQKWSCVNTNSVWSSSSIYENKDYTNKTFQSCDKSSCTGNIDNNNIQCYLCDKEFTDIEDYGNNYTI